MYQVLFSFGEIGASVGEKDQINGLGLTTYPHQHPSKPTMGIICASETCLEQESPMAQIPPSPTLTDPLSSLKGLSFP